MELKEHLNNNQGDKILLRMTAYSANVTGSDSYWYGKQFNLYPK